MIASRPATILFFALVIGLALALFPKRQAMVGYYLQAGNIAESKRILDELNIDESDDFSLLVESAHIHFLLGELPKAIANLDRAAALKPHNINALRTLAQYSEWALKPEQALASLQALAAIDPNDAALRCRIIDYLRYFNRSSEESAAIASALPVVAKSNRWGRDPLSRAILAELSLLKESLETSGPEPLRDTLMRRLFLLGELARPGQPENEDPDLEALSGQALEQFIAAGQIDRGWKFSTRLDAARPGSVFFRMTFLLGMAWNHKQDEALPMLLGLFDEHPGDKDIHAIIMDTARESRSFPAAERILLALHQKTGRIEPLAELAVLAGEMGQGGRAAELVRDAWSRGDAALPVMRLLLEAALISRDKTLMADGIRLYDKRTDWDAGVQLQAAYLLMDLKQPQRAFAILAPLVQGNAATKVAYAAALFDAASEAVDFDLYTRALSLAARWLDQPETRRARVRALLSLNRPDEAMELAEKLVENSVPVSRVADQNLLLDAAALSSKAEQALRALTPVITDRPEDPRVLFTQASLLFALNRTAEARAVLDRLRAMGGADPDALAAMAESSNIPPAAAESIYAYVLAMAPDNVRALWGRAESLLAAKRPAEAYPLLRRRLELLPARTRADKQHLLDAAAFSGQASLVRDAATFLARLGREPWLDANVARAYMSAGHSGEAVPILEAQARRSGNRGDWELLVRAARESGDPAVMRSVAAAAEARTGRDPGLWPVVARSLADLYSWSNLPADAARILLRLSRQSPGDTALAIRAAEAAMDAGRPSDALDALNRSVRLAPDDAKILGMLALANSRLQRTQQVLALSRQLERFPSLPPDVREVLAEAHAAVKDWPGARRQLERLGTEAARSPRHKILLARILTGEQKQAEAVSVLTALLDEKLAADEAAQVGFLALDMRRLELAERALRLSQVLRPGNAEAEKGFAALAAARGDLQRAVTLQQRQAARQPDDPEALFQLGEQLRAAGRLDEAERAYERAMRLLEMKK